MLNSFTLLHRELLVGARQRSTWLLRVGMALASAVVGGLLFWWIRKINIAGGMAPGMYLFYFVAWMGLGATGLFGVFFAADTVSAERREGTLGLLFLTRLRAHDVVLGKLAAIFVRSAYALLAALPMIALPMLLGGVTFKTYGLTALVLGNTLFLSATVGLAVSAFNQQPVRAVMSTLFGVMTIALLPVIIDAWIADYLDAANFEPLLSIISPGYAHYQAVHDGGNGLGESLAWQHGLGWALLLLATRGTRRFNAKSREPSQRRWIRWLMGRQENAATRRLRDRRPVQWLTVRRGRGPTILALAVAIMAGGYCAWLGLGDDISHLTMVTTVLNFAVSPLYFVLIIWIAAEAARRTGDARREGALELILATPLTIPEVVSGFWWGLVRMFGVAILILLLLQLVGGAVQLIWSYDSSVQQIQQNSGNNNLVAAIWESYYQLIIWLGFGLLNTILLPAALAWVGLWLGLRMEKPAAAAATTFVIVAVAPTLALLIFSVFSMTITMFISGPGMYWLSALIQGAFAIVIKLAFIFWARRSLLRHFRETTNGTFRPRLPRINKFKAPPPLPA